MSLEYPFKESNLIPKPRLLVNIVLYNPDKEKILALIHICLKYEQVKILLFDNASDRQCLKYIDSEKVILYQSSTNVGVAAAHCAACKMAEAENFDFVLFLDQDSLLPMDFINTMICEFYRLRETYPRLSAIGPSWQDPRICQWYRDGKSNSNLSNKIKQKIKKFLGMTQLKEKMYKLLRLKHILISSGMLIWVPALKEIGYPKKEYFIDLIDIEWCLRALLKNYQIETLKNVKMLHTIGEFKILKNKFLKYQNPVRYYYAIRNSFFLFRERQYPLSFRTFILIHNILQIKKIPFVPEPKKSLIAAFHGLKDGVLSRKKIYQETLK